MYQDYFLIPPTRSEINICSAVARRYARMSSTPTLQPGAGALRHTHTHTHRDGDRLRYKWCCGEMICSQLRRCWLQYKDLSATILL